VKKRYDYILISPDWRVVDLQYLHEGAVQHGSDHALVVADLSLDKRYKEGLIVELAKIRD